jgi:hypothetical protein
LDLSFAGQSGCLRSIRFGAILQEDIFMSKGGIGETIFIRYEAINLLLTYGGKNGLFDFLEGKTVSNLFGASVDSALVRES